MVLILHGWDSKVASLEFMVQMTIEHVLFHSKLARKCVAGFGVSTSK